MLFGVVITLAVALAIAVIVGTVGTPIAVRIARPMVWSRTPLGADRTGPAPAPPPSFEPLDLGPDPMRWPSETPWASSKRPELPWPSQTWDDPHFGAHWRTHLDGNAADEAYEAKQAARRALVEQQRRQEEGRANQRSQAAQQQRAARQPTPAGTGAKRRAQEELANLRRRANEASQRVQAQVGDPRVAVQQQARQAAQQAQQAARREAARQVEQRVPGASKAMANVPPPAELERMVAELGLAGTVQKIMERTGWDFKTAAQHLARARRGR